MGGLWEQYSRGLLDSGQQKLLEQFGVCPTKGKTTKSLEAKKDRTQAILDSMNEMLEVFPSDAFKGGTYTAEQLVTQLPPERLCEVLTTAYQCNFCKIFAGYAKPGPGQQSLQWAVKAITTWLDGERSTDDTRATCDEPAPHLPSCWGRSTDSA